MRRMDPVPATSGWLLHDGDCGFCTAAADWLVRRGMRAGSRTLQSAEADWRLDVYRTTRQVPFRHPDGRVTWGAEAIADALRTCPQPLALVGRLLGTRLGLLVGAPVYGLVAANRHRLPGATSACGLGG